MELINYFFQTFKQCFKRSKNQIKLFNDGVSKFGRLNFIVTPGGTRKNPFIPGGTVFLSNKIT